MKSFLSVFALVFCISVVADEGIVLDAHFSRPCPAQLRLAVQDGKNIVLTPVSGPMGVALNLDMTSVLGSWVEEVIQVPFTYEGSFDLVASSGMAGQEPNRWSMKPQADGTVSLGLPPMEVPNLEIPVQLTPLKGRFLTGNWESLVAGERCEIEVSDDSSRAMVDELHAFVRSLIQEIERTVESLIADVMILTEGVKHFRIVLSAIPTHGNQVLEIEGGSVSWADTGSARISLKIEISDELTMAMNDMGAPEFVPELLKNQLQVIQTQLRGQTPNGQ